MITSEQLLNYQFQKAGMNGYRAIEVDELITSVAETITFYEKKLQDMQRKIDDLKRDENIIQATLVNAQKLANQVVDEAQAQADDIVAQAQAQADAITAQSDSFANEAQAQAQAQASEMMDNAKKQATALIEQAKRTADEIGENTKQELAVGQQLLGAMKNEVADFRSKLLSQYKEHIELINNLPDEVVELNKSKPQPEAEQEEPSAQPTGSNIVKILDELKENESAADEAVAQVSELISESDEKAESEQPNQSRFNGFSVVIDDED